MPNSYLSEDLFTPDKTPQSEPIHGEKQVKNSAGGYVYELDKWSTLQRFLILGTEGGTYYASQHDLTKENSKNLLDCIAEDGLRTVRIITEISLAGRAPKNDQAIYALALASIKGDDKTRRAAHEAIKDVCRIGTHLFMFAEFRKGLGGGTGRGVRRGLGDWYATKDAETLAYQAIKYRQRGRWTHADVLRLSNIVGDELPDQVNDTLRWITKVATHGSMAESFLREKVFKRSHEVPKFIEGFERVQAPGLSAKDAAKLVREYNLPREALQTEHLNSVEVWDALLPGMPLTALIRNLATMTRIDLLTPTSQATKLAIEKLSDGDHLRKSRVHPMTILFALKTYAAGKGVRSSNTWAPLGPIVDALDDAFYAAFDNVEATGKRRMIALDISGSMWSNWDGQSVGGVPGFTAAQGAAAMSMVSVKSGDPYEVVCFTTTSDGRRSWYGRQAPNSVFPGLSPLALSKKQRLDDVDRLMREMSQYMGGTDCALPMLYAESAKREVDVFEIYTDNETWAGGIHPSQALRQYRQTSGINAKLIVVGMTATEFSIADPNDAGMLDVVGFDTNAPQLMASFAKDQL
jgi:60 kDa SS-A/Ro ribonucleoprotein